MSRALPIRCDDCARDLGRAAPTLVVAGRDQTGWYLFDLGQRRPGRGAWRNDPPPGLPTQGPGGYIMVGGRTFDAGHRHRGRAVPLTCRRCKRSGWRRRRLLYETAEAAQAAGRSDAYLSLA
jgi:hypothetical protein